MQNPIILHVDMNSYFASVEQQANPHLRGQPVGVCEHLGGIIIAPSVEAKRMGITLGTTVWDARRMCPWIEFLPVDPDKYRSVTASFLRVLSDYSDKVDKSSIDEAFVDISRSCRDYEDALLLALEIKQRIRLEVGEWISCSTGIGPNKLLAKIAADLGEGDMDRICAIRPNEIPALYDRLKLTDIPGIGKRIERSLRKLGIFTLKALAQYPAGNLLNYFGIMGYFLHEMANFRTSDLALRFVSSSEAAGIKSIGHSYTLPKPIRQISDIKKLMYKLSEKIGRRMRKQKARGSIVHYFHSGPLRFSNSGSGAPPARYEDIDWMPFHKQHKISEYINDGKDIYNAAFRIFGQSSPRALLGANREISGSIKIMGISVSGLSFEKFPQPLFDAYNNPARLVRAMDAVNDKYGEFTIRRGRLAGMPDEWAKDTVGFGRMKELF